MAYESLPVKNWSEKSLGGDPIFLIGHAAGTVPIRHIQGAYWRILAPIGASSHISSPVRHSPAHSRHLLSQSRHQSGTNRAIAGTYFPRSGTYWHIVAPSVTNQAQSRHLLSQSGPPTRNKSAHCRHLLSRSRHQVGTNRPALALVGTFGHQLGTVAAPTFT
jgi:hypothetical protein